MTNADTLEPRPVFVGLVPDEVTVVHVHPARYGLEVLEASERATVTRAVEKRQREFASGRWAARQALVAMGHAAVAIPSNPDRSPQWPSGIVGSITHCGAVCAAALAHENDFVGLGIDAEDRRQDVLRLWEQICFGDEIDWITKEGAPNADRILTIFSCKESFFKAEFPYTGIWLDFHEVRVVPGPGDQFAMRVVGKPWPPTLQARGRFAVLDEVVASFCVLESIPGPR